MSGADNCISQIQESGYGKIEGAVSPEIVTQLKKRVEVLFEEKRNQVSGKVPFLNIGHQMLYNLQNKDVLFCRTMLSHPDVVKVLMTFLNDQWYRQIPADKPNYILRSLLARSGGPEAMPLHIDSFIPGSGAFSWSLQVAIILQDQSVENGCTLVVPGSHLANRYASQDDLKDAKPLSSKAGDLVFWDSRLWHAAAGNKSGNSRWSVIGTFGRWWLKQNYDIPRTLPQSIYAELTNEERGVLGFCSIPPKDEFERIDIKAGYDILQDDLKDRM